MNTIREVKRIVISKKFGKLQAEPYFGNDKVIFFNLDKASPKVKSGELWKGRTTSPLISLNKEDKCGTPMFMQYWIPETKINEGEK